MIDTGSDNPMSASPQDMATQFADFVRILQGAGTAQQTMQKLVDLAPSTIPGCEYAGVSMMTGNQVATPAASGEVPRAVDRIQYEASEGPCLDAIREHHIFMTDDLAAEQRWPNFAARAAAETGVRSMLSFRLFVEEDTLGSLNLYSKEIAAFGAEASAAGAVFAAHAAVAVLTAREHDHAQRLELDLTKSERAVRALAERAQVAAALQRSMLPTLPSADRFELAARYVPATSAAEVGGDWFDAFALPSGHMALVIGDVVGHDLTAAIRMSQLKSMLRTLAVDRGEPPAEVLRRLDRISEHLEIAPTATCIYAAVDDTTASAWTVAFANAGHPPPLLITADGQASFLETADHLMLGLGADLPRSNAVIALPAGSTLLLYTDGLVETRGASISAGLAALQETAGLLAGHPLEHFCDEVVRRLAARPEDDVCLLAMRTPASPV